MTELTQHQTAAFILAAILLAFLALALTPDKKP